MTDTTRPAHAGVHFPPPLWYLAGLAAGEGLHLWHPWYMTQGASPARVAAGMAGVAVYLALFLGALTAFRRAHTTLIPNKPAAAFVTNGPYRFTRNPMYVSLAAVYLGLSALANSWWPVVLLPLVIIAVDRMVIAREERYLASAFPDEYSVYRGRVRRWL